MPSPSASRLFCSIADANYLAQALVMHRSLRELLPGARNLVLCADDGAHRVLASLAPPGLEPVAMSELEGRDPALRSVRPGRSAHEYCQTAKPAFCMDLLRGNPEVGWVTYVDADSMFFTDPEPLFEELEGCSVGIVGHRFAPRFRSRERWASPYCPSWVSFAGDERGREVAAWWRARCLEWCYHRVEGERHSDQGYLRDWPERFAGVHVLEHPGIGPAPWTDNAGLAASGGRLTIDGEPLVAFHYQSLRVQRPRGSRPRRALPGAPLPLAWRIYGGYRISPRERELVWEPYLRRLGEALGEVWEVDPEMVEGLRPRGPRALARAARQHAWMRMHDWAASPRGPLDRTA